MSEAAGLSYSQIVNWTTNVRKRNLKATVEHGKKPHHFLDFLFLADDREKRMLEEGGELPKVAAAYLSNKKGGKSSTKRQTTKSKTKSKAQPRSTSASKPRGAAAAVAAAAGTAKQQPSEGMPLSAFQPSFAHGSRPMHPHQLPPPLVKGVSPYPPIAVDGRPPYPPLSYPPNAHSARAPYPGYMPNWHRHPQPPPTSRSQPLPMDTRARNGAPSLRGGVTSPPHHQTESHYQNDSRATVTPSSASPTASRRNTGDSLDEALSFWNSSLFSADGISNDALLSGNGFGAHAAGVDDEEKAALLRVTEGGIISTPPREDEDDELWLGTGEDDVLDSFDSDADGPTKRSSIIDAAMLPLARNEKARRMSQRKPSGHGATWRSSASAGGAEHLQQQHTKRMSLTVDEVAQALAMPLPLDDDDGLMREFLDENITAVGV